MNTISTLIKTSLLGIVAMASVNGYSQSFLTNGLVAFYPFNGNANDASGNGHNAVVNSNTVLTANQLGVANSAYHFQGAKMQFVNIPVNLAGPCSFGLWLKLYAYYDGSVVAELNDTNYDCDGEPLFAEYNASLTCSGCGGGWGPLSFGPESQLLNTWHHIFLSIAAGGQTTLYLDGVTMINKMVSEQATTFANLTLGAVGNTSAGTAQFSTVDLDDVRIYNRALSSAEVEQIYAFESGGPHIDLVKAVKPSFSNLYLGTNYQLQISTDLVNWTNSGSAFTATNSSMVSTQYFDVPNWNQLFFRLQ